MSAITDFAAKQSAANDRMDAAIAALQTKIDALVAAQGQITPADQALLDAAATRSEATAAQLETLAS